MDRRVILAAWWLAAACASSTPAAPLKSELEEACEKDAGHDKRCIEVLTGGGDGYEARQEVMNREASRDADEFHSRLARLRREQDERAASSGTSSVAPPLDPELLAPLTATSPSGTNGDEVDSGSSVRALKPQLKPPIRLSLKLVAASCLLGGDLPKMQALIANEPDARSDKGALGVFARMVDEAAALLGLVSREIEKRETPKEETNCATQDVREVVELLRSLVGPPAARLGDAESYTRGLARLRTMLEEAGLPKLR